MTVLGDDEFEKAAFGERSNTCAILRMRRSESGKFDRVRRVVMEIVHYDVR